MKMNIQDNNNADNNSNNRQMCPSAQRVMCAMDHSIEFWVS